MKISKNLIACAAAFAVAAAAAAPCAAREIDVKVSTFGVYESKYEGFEARIVTPIVTGLAMDSLEKEINAKLAEKALEMQERYELEALELMNDPFAGNGAHTGWFMDYKVIDGDARFVTLDVTETNIVASSSTKRTIMNFDKETGMPVTLASFFNEKADAVEVVSRAVRDEMRRANKKHNGSFWLAPEEGEQKKDEAATGGFSSIKADQNFYVDREGNIVVCFDKYEVAPGSAGCPEITLDMKKLEPWLKAEK